ncbi:MAG TPA: hypothetical protein PLJ59_01600 [Solirubrobacterales bacterium]|nr:hypothetical protein [Solirubrobacterales bacterium]
MAGTPGLKTSSLGGLAALVAFFTVAVLAGPPARAATNEELSSCSEIKQTIEQPDGSIVGMGDCRYGVSPAPRIVLVGLNPDGSDRTAFADGGAALISVDENEFGLKIIGRPDGSFLVLSQKRIWSFDGDGDPVESFGNHGVLNFSAADQMNLASAFDFALDSGGNLLVAGRRPSTATPVVGKYDQTGQLVSGYGNSGVSAELDLNFDAAIAVDNSNRVVMVGEDGATRLLADGSLDLSFGPENDGYADLPAGLPYSIGEVFGLTVHPDDSITAYLDRTPGMYYYPAYAVSLDSDGSPAAEDALVALGDHVSAVAPFDGGVAFVRFPGRGFQHWQFEVGTTNWPGIRSVTFSPGDSLAHGVTALSDGSLLVSGNAQGPDCSDSCVFRNHLALAKIDPGTGDLVESFGSGGERLIPPNGCSRGQAGKAGDWNICRVRPPGINGSVRFAGAGSKHPSLVLKASLGDPPEGLVGTRQRLTVDLPRKLRLRPGGLKGRVRVSVSPATPRTVKVQGKRITILARPEYNPYETAGESDAKDSRLTFRITVNRGALAPITRPGRLHKRIFGLRGEFNPVWNGFPTPEGGPWFSPNSAFRRIKAAAPSS